MEDRSGACSFPLAAGGGGGVGVTYGPVSGAEFALIHPHLSRRRRQRRIGDRDGRKGGRAQSRFIHNSTNSFSPLSYSIGIPQFWTPFVLDAQSKHSSPLRETQWTEKLSQNDGGTDNVPLQGARPAHWSECKMRRQARRDGEEIETRDRKKNLKKSTKGEKERKARQAPSMCIHID